MYLNKELLRPVKGGTLCRVGNPVGDGGYVLPLEALEVDYCYSYGIGTEITFERDLIKRWGFDKSRILGFDHTIAPLGESAPFLHYTKGLSGSPDGPLDDFLAHWDQNGHSGKCLLKVDVEGAEYDWLKKTNIQRVSEIAPFLVVEFHSIENPVFEECINIIKTKYNILHLHFNNYGWKMNDGIPNVAEITFGAAYLPTFGPIKSGTYPIPLLDAPNNGREEGWRLDYNFNQ